MAPYAKGVTREITFQYILLAFMRLVKLKFWRDPVKLFLGLTTRIYCAPIFPSS